MKSILAILLGFASAINGHYVISKVGAGGSVSGSDWQYIRQTSNFQSNGPIQDVSSSQMTCYERNPGSAASGTLNVQAGGQMTFGITPNLFHPGPAIVYMAKAPGSAASFDGKGPVWFKIWEDKPRTTSNEISWPNYNKNTVTVPIPSCLADGEYLVRFEHIALHSASSPGGAQLYLSCAQVKVSGGSGTYSPSKMSFPGAYSPSDPGLQVNIYWPIPTNYKAPGGPVMQC